MSSNGWGATNALSSVALHAGLASPYSDTSTWQAVARYDVRHMRLPTIEMPWRPDPELLTQDLSLFRRNSLRCQAFLGELLFIGCLITRNLGSIGGEIAEARRIIGVAGLVEFVQVELAGV
jgi:hypothetical protein